VAQQGAVSAEVQAVQTIQSAAQGATAYLNLESGDCHGDDAAVHALINAQVSRVVIGIRHPLAHMRGTAIRALRAHGVAVGGCNVLAIMHIMHTPSCKRPGRMSTFTLDSS
jgi:pyrimidine deaminase RibD-like protein